MLLEPLSKDGKPQGKCLAKKCSDCNFYRKWQLSDPITQAPRIETKCSWESVFFNLPTIIGSIDGCQAAANEARNRAMETKAAVFGFGQAATVAIEKLVDVSNGRKELTNG